MRHEWSGDVDLDTGDLQQEFKVYRDLLDFYKAIRIGSNCVEDLGKCCQILLEEKIFILTGIYKVFPPLAGKYHVVSF